MTTEKQGLCFRCEYRARFYETGHGPRYECQQPEITVCSCYMYKPVRPVITVPSDPKDKRPRHGPAIISSRERFEAVAEDMQLAIRQNGEESTLYWVPPDNPT